MTGERKDQPIVNSSQQKAFLESLRIACKEISNLKEMYKKDMEDRQNNCDHDIEFVASHEVNIDVCRKCGNEWVY
jgi:hypothetical protein